MLDFIEILPNQDKLTFELASSTFFHSCSVVISFLFFDSSTVQLYTSFHFFSFSYKICIFNCLGKYTIQLVYNNNKYNN